ncbi:hypothetical protein ACX93W_14980 [Paenibacillus sp. CAU 1782]
MKKTAGTIILVFVCLVFAGCNEKGNFKAELEKIVVPDMSATILDFSELDQLAWLEEIYQFEVDTMRSKTSELSEEDLNAIKAHLSQVFNSEEAGLLIDGFYHYDGDKQTYYVPDGDWFTYSREWPSTKFTLSERSEQSATFMLSGTDLTENERNIQFDFSISDGKLLVDGRTYLN